MAEIILDGIEGNHSGAEGIDPGNARDSERGKKVEILRLRNRLKNAVFHLKTELSAIKAKNSAADEFDVSEHWDAILDLREILNEIRQKLDKETLFPLGKKEFEESKKVSGANLERIIEKLEGVTDKSEIEPETAESPPYGCIGSFFQWINNGRHG
ncbi:MAG: hypothetical protein AAGE99_01635 [Chlamydiota bacterium]